MTEIVRFAPSPTGYLHAGNARTAVLNWLYARATGGKFILRIDDTDLARSTPEYEAAIFEDMAWMGLTHDHTAKQSQRLGEYGLAAEQLKAKGLLYACYETPEELELKRKVQLSRGRPPVYDRAALNPSAADKAKWEAEGRKPHWRFKLTQKPVTWDDGIHGPVTIDGASLSDPVLVRADGVVLYTLASVTDDLEMGVTRIIRGDDHIANTAVQIELFEALGGKAPGFAHFGLFTGAGGEGLSKRTGALSIRSMREEMGIEPQALISLLAHLGTSEAVEPVAEILDLAKGFSLSQISRAPVRFDLEDLAQLNAKLLHLLPFSHVAPRLAALGVEGGADFWDAVRGNLAKLSDAAQWWQVIAGSLPAQAPDPVAQAAEPLLPAEPWDENTWPVWTKLVAEKTGAKGKALFLPLRLALTGREHGPEMKKLLPLFAPGKVRARLRGEAA